MSQFTDDLSRSGPAPTLARELPVAVVILVVTAGAVWAALTMLSSPVLATVAGALGVVYAAIRLGIVARRQTNDRGRR